MQLTTVVSKADLIARLKANRSAHKEQYEEAVEAFWGRAQKFISTTAERVEKRDPIYLKLSKGGGAFGDLGVRAMLGVLGLGTDEAMPAPPPSYLKTYDQALEMIEMHQEDTVELEAQDFNCLVRDEWEWKPGFQNSYAGLITG